METSTSIHHRHDHTADADHALNNGRGPRKWSNGYCANNFTNVSSGNREGETFDPEEQKRRGHLPSLCVNGEMRYVRKDAASLRSKKQAEVKG